MGTNPTEVASAGESLIAANDNDLAPSLAADGGSGGQSWVFRGVNTAPDTVFNEGFTPKGTSMDLMAHAIDSDFPPSGYVATSTDFDVASDYGRNVYVISRPANGIDVNATLGNASPNPGDSEIAIPGPIDPSQIRAVTIPSQGVSILNPNYLP